MSEPVVEALWKNVVDDWDNDAAHVAFLEHCRVSDQLLEAAVRYRGMTGDRARAPSAEKRLEGVALMALSQLEATRTTPRQARRQTAKLMLIFIFLSASLAMLWLNMR